MPKASKGGFYAVKIGRATGVYLTWDECEAQVKGYTGARYKKFTNAPEAEEYAGIASSSSRRVPTVKTMSHSRTSPAKSKNGRVDHAEIADEKGWDVVYCDGACKGNGQVGSVAGIGVWWGKNHPSNLSERCPGDQTNNRAELTAIVRILETTPISRKPLLIKTDSQYSISCVKEWLPKWRINNFKLSTGQPVKNAPLIRYLSALLDKRAIKGQKVRLQHVKGHAGEEGNECADALANQGCGMGVVSEKEWEVLERNVREELSVDVVEEEAPMKATPVKDKVVDVPVTPNAEELKLYAECLLDDFSKDLED